MIRRAKKMLGRMRDDQSGAAAVEFVLVAPLYLGLVFSTFEAGWLMTKSMMLERGLDMTVRELRRGTVVDLPHDHFKKSICSHTSLLPDCQDSMLLELVEVDPDSTVDIPKRIICRDGTSTVAPSTGFEIGRANALMYVKACVLVRPLMPGIGLGLHLPKTEDGHFALVAYSAFVNEPDPSKDINALVE